MKRLIALLLVVVMTLGMTAALAEDTWDCPECGRKGNTSQFCPDCGTKKPEVEVTKAPTVTNIKVGDYVLFGNYEQSKGGVEPIRWLVIDVKDGKLFLLSEKGLERRRFNSKSDGSTWSDCELRDWLNSTFYRTAFNASEREEIQTTKVDDGPDQANPTWDKAGRYSGFTDDKVFLLSYQEMLSLVDLEDRRCEPTIAVMAKGVYLEKYNGKSRCWYWLRTSAFKNNAGVVEPNGDFDTCYIHHDYGVVRPALWVNASAVTKDN